jgi:hypothetical protein
MVSFDLQCLSVAVLVYVSKGSSSLCSFLDELSNRAAMWRVNFEEA